MAGLFVERLEPPIIQYQELNMAQGSLQAGVAAKGEFVDVDSCAVERTVATQTCFSLLR